MFKPFEHTQEKLNKKTKNREEVNNMLDNWKSYTFESSSGLTPEFAAFDKDFRKYLIHEFVKHGYTVEGYSRGHFFVSGFLKNKNTGKLAYFNIDDVRFNPDWSKSLLVRTAEHNKDYTGGANRWTTLEGLKEKCDELTA